MAVTVTGVEPGSPAARVGVRAGDTLLKIGPHPITSSPSAAGSRCAAANG